MQSDKTLQKSFENVDQDPAGNKCKFISRTDIYAYKRTNCRPLRIEEIQCSELNMTCDSIFGINCQSVRLESGQQVVQKLDH